MNLNNYNRFTKRQMSIGLLAAAVIGIVFLSNASAMGVSMKDKSEPVTRTFGNETQEQKDARMQWWREARFGMFIHWGLYSVLEGEWKDVELQAPKLAEWIMHGAQIPLEEYELLCEEFNPVKFDADAWVRMARDAGMKYLVITTKHHEGFCLWPSEVGEYNVAERTPFKRDILGELAAACKKYDVRLCFYYSIMDWHHPDYLPRLAWDTRPTEDADFSRYIQYMKAQLKELITRYDPAVLWFDGEWEKTWTHEMGLDLYHYVRSLKPDIIINNRVDKGRDGMAGLHDPATYAGDFGTPEKEVPATGLPGYDWESCITMNHHWGWHKNDKDYKSSRDLIRMLVDIVSKGGNLLLNIGPRPDGTFPPESVERLAAIGDWMKINSASIYGTTASPFPELEWGCCTRKTDGDITTLYLHVFDWPKDGKLVVPGLENDIQKAYLMANKQTLQTSVGDDSVTIEVPKEPLDKINTVIVLTVKGTL